MKRLRLLVIGVAIWFVLPAGVGAQGWTPSDAASLLPGLSSFWPGSVSDGHDSAKFFCGPDVYVGRLEHGQGSIWALQRTDSKGTAAWPLKGYWVSGTEEIRCYKGFGLLVSGGIFIPQHSAGNWYSTPDFRSFDFEIPSYDWWMAEGLVRTPLYGPLVLLAGVRWDHTSTRVDYSDNTSDDYILNAYLPLIGFRINQEFAGGSCLLRLVGTRLVSGRIRYHFWDRLGFAEFGDFDVKSGSFVEALADYRFNVAGGWSLGGFVKWNALKVNTSERNLSGSTTEPVSWEVDIRSWTFGGVASVAFSSPF